jgi:hypothetical protein
MADPANFTFLIFDAAFIGLMRFIVSVIMDEFELLAEKTRSPDRRAGEGHCRCKVPDVAPYAQGDGILGTTVRPFAEANGTDDHGAQRFASARASSPQAWVRGIP